MVNCAGRFSPGRLADWLRTYPAESRWLDAFRRSASPKAPVSEEDSWRLYALSRVLELMNLTFQHGDADSWAGPGLARGDAAAFATDLGLSVAGPPRYAAFDCEIVRVVATDDDDDEPVLVDVHWPSVVLGDMMVCRAGVTVAAGRRVMNPSVAASSTIYWAYGRRNRPHEDLSNGWGSNSQWRTSFRRDYRTAAKIYYNVDGRFDLAAGRLAPHDDSALTRPERLELLVNRCFVVTQKPSDDLWPYDDRVTMTA